MKTGVKMIVASFGVLMAGLVYAEDAISCDGNQKLPTAGGFDKKYIGLFFDVFKTSPSNILENADQFAKHAPFLDGVAIGITADVADSDGNIVTAKHSQIMHRSQRWTREEVKKHLPYLKEIAKKPNLTESMLLFWMSPSGPNRINWDDDEGWANYAENMANVAWLAKEAGLKGLMLDPEEYAAQGGNFAQYIHCYKDPPFAETAKLARQRGREVFSRVFKEFPDAVIISLWCFKKFGFWLEDGRQPYPLENVDQSGELLHYFLNGMIDVMPPDVRVVEGSEAYSHSAVDNFYIQASVLASTTVLPLVAPENIVKYRSQFYFGNTHFFDMYRTNANPKSRWYHGPVNGSRLEHMRLNFEQSLQTATKYVWLYGEGNGKLFDWRDGHFEKVKTWEELSPGMTETIMMVKDPLGFAARRKTALAKEGKLVNLAEDLKGFVLERRGGVTEFHPSDDKLPSVKDVKPGERYAVNFIVSEMGAKSGTFRDGAAMPFIYWKKNGKRTSDKPVEIKINRDQPRVGRYGYQNAETEVVVPAGVDELVLDLGAKLLPDERVGYKSIAVNKLYGPAKTRKGASGRKWKFDADKKILSDGNWKLSAKLNKRTGTLSVSGENEQTKGSGVLDFTTVKSDTGYSVVQIGKLQNIQSMTAFYAPDVTSARAGGIGGCSNVTDVVVGEMKTHSSIVSLIAQRVSRLKSLGLKPTVPLAVRGVDYRNRFVLNEGAPHDLAVKGVKPGELYTVGLSMKRRGPGLVFLNTRFRANGEEVKSNGRIPQIVMRGPRMDDVWQSGEVVVRVPDGADELYIDVRAELTQGYTCVEFSDFKVYKIGEPLPVWPAETVREKEWRK